LRREISGDLVVPASVRIARTLLEHGLVDEVRLKVFPVVLGAGERLFDATGAPVSMRLASVRTLDGDTAALTYTRSPSS
jgi:dihydrofolate reductase